jgi:hypothetical protein
MMCERCDGIGFVRFLRDDEVWAQLPCPECNGWGVGSCCQGHEAQAELANDDA